MQLEQVFETAFANVVASGQIERHFEEVLAKTIKEVIEGKLRSYSDFGKQVEKAVTESLQIGDLTLPIFGERVAQLIRQITEQQIEATFEQSLRQRLEDLLVAAPRELTLTKLCEEFCEYFSSEEDNGRNWSLHFDRTHPHLDCLRDLWTLSFDDDEDVAAVDCDVRIRLREIKGTADRYQFDGLVLNGKDVEKRLFIGPEHGFAKTCWQMYAAKTVLVLDVSPDNINTYIGDY